MTSLCSFMEKYVIFNNKSRKYITTPKSALDRMLNENREENIACILSLQIF